LVQRTRRLNRRFQVRPVRVVIGQQLFQPVPLTIDGLHLLEKFLLPFFEDSRRSDHSQFRSRSRMRLSSRSRSAAAASRLCDDLPVAL
jgi:hypothetical protein